MKTTEEYFDDYLDKYNDLKKKDELWKFRVSPQEFLIEIEKIRANGVAARKAKSLTEYHITSSENAQVEVLLMDRVTRGEAIEIIKKWEKSQARLDKYE